MEPSKLLWDSVVSQPFAENTYVVRLDGCNECIIVDPGLEPQKIVDFLDNVDGGENSNAKLVPVAILNTHGHSDHIGGNQFMKDRWPDIPLIIGQGDAYKLLDADANLSAPFGLPFTSPPADQTVAEGETLSFAGVDWEVLETPGHSAGHVVFVCKQVRPWIVLGGDVLFQNGVGRTDFPDGSMEDLVSSIHNKLFPMPSDTVVLPGHGPETTIGHEKQFNPFVALQS